ncbi:MAG: hypothetical protein JGK17_05875 [Microcoleus sp. PH2017_10_PVI_O_A]|uniref:hypothetical protein n=1 Tax=unclassified Microcoleus TaxID=2642155 RepID=UPI001D4250D3|nr:MULTISPECIES: hypothetical protein [unclassified Microcoleus]MCC3405114.1 hypothetical protein [Microcoleus sp. PH2017_10_PVI_O_A]MCC3459197.1 hypothetical protein [Microcoleus sp. PH2017_11_PCY_U_A]MCC3477484.1 hypothetical protein [Microcoleus sp. PH2017_12_PCY_D_A]MCC3528653.1 hypothetical protein [Microcoleus sp. PH2017_21_RUC_O_A]MCC3540863.1 hypothetical protein [Microcoleus sp. PH2017_22_RUC_O_B]
MSRYKPGFCSFLPKWQHGCAIVPDNVFATQKRQTELPFMLLSWSRVCLYGRSIEPNTKI